MKKTKRTKKFIGTPIQKKILLLIFISAIIPMGIAIVSLYYLIFNLLAWQIGIPEAIAYNLNPVVKKINLIIVIALPISLLLIWVIALELSHRIAGPIFRLEKELDDRILGKVHGTISLRRKDEFRLLVDKINRLMYYKK